MDFLLIHYFFPRIIEGRSVRKLIELNFEVDDFVNSKILTATQE